LQLEMEEEDIKSDLKLHDINPTQVNYRNVVTVNLQNPEAKILAPLDVHAAVYKEKREEPLFEEENEDVRMAPNSNFDYVIPWNNQPFKPGKYRLELEASNEDDEWSWTENFEIEEKEAEESSRTRISLFYILYYWWYYFSFIISDCFFLVRKKNEQKGGKQ